MRTIFARLLVAALFFCAVESRAQTFGSGVAITGTTNAQLQVAGVVFTNYAFITIPLKAVTLSNIGNTNETAILSYGFTIVGQTNVIILASITNSFAAGTNGGSWSPSIPAQTITVPVIPWAQANVGTNSNNIYFP